MQQTLAKIIFCLFGLLLNYSISAQGVFYTWTGGVSTDWNDEDNWSPKGIPQWDSSVNVPETGTINRPTLTSHVQVFNIHLSGEIDVNGQNIAAYPGTITFSNAIVKNSVPSSTSYFGGYFYGLTPVTIEGSMFEGDVVFGMICESDQAEASNNPNHYKGNVTFTCVRGEYNWGINNFSICKNYASIFEKNLNIIAQDMTVTIGEAGIIFGGSSNGEITYQAAPLVISNATIKKTGNGKIVLTQTLTISNTLTFDSGIVESTASNPIIFGNNAGHIGARDISHIKGPTHKMGAQAFTFPVGSGAKLTPVSMTAPSGDEEFSAEYLESSPTASGYDTQSKAPTLSTVYNGGFWDIKRVSGTSSVKLSLGYNMAAGAINDQTKLRVAHWSGASWEDLGNGGISGSVTIGTVSTADVVTSFSPFTIATSDITNPLPIKLAKFSVQRENETAFLQWTTTEQINSDLFEIEHSNNAKTWKKISEVSTNGDHRALTDYHYVHPTPSNGVNYYRLKMVDLDGSFAYSQVETLKFPLDLKTIVYPNPVARKLFIQPANGLEVSEVKISNIVGHHEITIAGKNLKEGIDLTGLPEGIYFVDVNVINGSREIHKVLVHE